jgi:hypothetical protein
VAVRLRAPGPSRYEETGGAWERRVEAERTEVEPERTMQVWYGWDAAPVCDWMRGQLDQAADAGTQRAQEPPTEEPAEFDLTPVPAGDHVMALVAWAPDATAKPVSVTLPSLTIRPEPG